VNNEIHNINEAYTQVNEIAFAHQDQDPLQFLLQQVQKASGPVYGIPDDVIKSLIEEYSNDANSNPTLIHLNHNLLDLDLFLLELSRAGKNFYVLLDMDGQFVYPNVYTDFNEARSYVLSILNKS
jgi:hypothetical protein